MADRDVDVLLIGGGAASAACANELRKLGFDGSVLIAGRELDPPYDRPPCSKEYLGSDGDRASLLLELPEDVEVLTRSAVMKLDAKAREARLASKQTIGYGQALLATGANVRRLNVDGGGLEGVHYVRAPGNSEALRADLDAAGDDVVLVGGSFLGCELAATLTELGKRVTMVFQEDVPMKRFLGEEAGRWYERLLDSHGVRLVASAEIAAFEGSGERVERVRTAGGEELPAGLVVVAIGAVPETMLAKSAGLELGDTGGVKCDAMLRTSAAGVFAAGDCCEWDSALHGGPTRVEHWDVAEAHGRTVARNLAGEPAEHTEVPYFWSDLADWGSIEYVGLMAESWDEEVVRGDPRSGHPFAVWQLDGGRLVGALSVDGADVLDRARELLSSGEQVDPSSLPGA